MPRLTSDDEAIGMRLRQLRTDRNMTLEQVSAEVGISYQQLGKYERGYNAISIAAMKRIAAVLGVRSCDICRCCDG